MSGGGARIGAGRKKQYTLRHRLAIANAVTIIQRDHGISRVKALKKLVGMGVVRSVDVITIQRYMTPRYLKKDIYEVLRTCDRTGILTLLPKL